MTKKILDYEIDLTEVDYGIDWNAVSDQMNMTTSLPSAQGSAIPSGSYTINTSQFNGTSGSYFYNTTNPTISVSSTDNSSSLDVNGDANFNGDIKWKGRSLGNMLETIEKRLAILQPDPEKLEHFEALQKAYQHYKTLESLCQLPKKEKE